MGRVESGWRERGWLRACIEDVVFCAGVMFFGMWFTGCSDDVCQATPVCQTGFVEVLQQSDCPANQSCIEVTTCGETIWCTEAPLDAGADAADATQSDTGSKDAAGDSCTALATCGSGQQTLDSQADCAGLTAGWRCVEVKKCNNSVWCAEFVGTDASSDGAGSDSASDAGTDATSDA